MYPSETARSIRRPCPNLMKLSGFVELVSLSILLKKKFFSISPYLYWYTVEILLPSLVIFSVFLHGKSFKWCRKTDETSLFLGQIINPMAYSDSSWKTASESFGVQNIPPSFSLTFSLTVCSSSHRKCMRISTWKTGMNQIWDICGFVERNLLYKMHSFVPSPIVILSGRMKSTKHDNQRKEDLFIQEKK